MPRNTRNFYVRTFIDGRKTSLSGGPVSAGGEMRSTYYIKENGTISDSKLTVQCVVRGELLAIIATVERPDMAPQEVILTTLRGSRAERRAPKPVVPHSLPALAEVHHG